MRHPRGRRLSVAKMLDGQDRDDREAESSDDGHLPRLAPRTGAILTIEWPRFWRIVSTPRAGTARHETDHPGTSNANGDVRLVGNGASRRMNSPTVTIVQVRLPVPSGPR